MSDTITEDTGLTGGEVDAESSTKTAEIGLRDLAFKMGQVEEAEDTETLDDSSEEEEKSATEAEDDSQDESSLTDDTEEESEEETEDSEEEEEDSKDEEPEWFRKRIDALTAQRKQAEERVEALEKKLEEKSESEEVPVSKVNEATTLEELEKVYDQATAAEDMIDEVLDQDPQVEEDDYGDVKRKFYVIGDKEFTRKELIDIRKNARTTIRNAPKRRQFLESKAQIEEQLAPVSFFAKEDDPYYDFAQDLLKSDLYKKIEPEIPNAKLFVAYAVQGKMALDAAQQAQKKAPKKAAKKTVKPTGKAATDTGTVASQETDTSQVRKKKKNLMSGTVDKGRAVELFKL